MVSTFFTLFVRVYIFFMLRLYPLRQAKINRFQNRACKMLKYHVLSHERESLIGKILYDIIMVVACSQDIKKLKGVRSLLKNPI